MNAPFQFAAQQFVAVAIDTAPVYNNLTSLALLTSPALPPDADPWLGETAAALSPEQRRRNRLAFDVFGELLLLPEAGASLPAFTARLRAADPALLRDQYLERVDAEANPPLSRADVLLRADAWQRLAQGRAESDLLAEAWRLLNDPPALQALLADHLDDMWQSWLAPEWGRKQPLLTSLRLGLERRKWPATGASEIIRLFLRREVPLAISAQLGGVRTVVFVLSPHISGHASRFGHADTIWVFVRGRAESLPLRQAPVKRVELVSPLAALADETRLRILELIAHHGPLLAQEVLAQLDLSQSSVSRHLKQLRSAGFLDEERGDGANKRYRFAPERIEWLARSLADVLAATPASGSPASAARTDQALDSPSKRRAAQPLELQRFLDGQDRVVSWPSKRKIQLLALRYLSDFFEHGRDYTEREVNELLNRWHTFGDHATLRRELFELGLLCRASDGSRYWREQPEV